MINIPIKPGQGKVPWLKLGGVLLMALVIQNRFGQIWQHTGIKCVGFGF